MILRPGVAYKFHVTPYSLLSIKKLDKQIISTTKTICKVPKSTPNLTTQLLHKLFGMNFFSFNNAYLKCIGEQLRDALNDQGCLKTIYKGLTKFIMAKNQGFYKHKRFTHTTTNTNHKNHNTT
jgi:hypothetical protein